MDFADFSDFYRIRFRFSSSHQRDQLTVRSRLCSLSRVSLTVLNVQHARNDFTCISFEPPYGLASEVVGRPRHLYAASTSGAIFVIDSDVLALKSIVQLHKSAIRSLAVSHGLMLN